MSRASQPQPQPPKNDSSYTIFLEDRVAKLEEELNDAHAELEKVRGDLRFYKGEARTSQQLADYYSTPEHEREDP